MAGYQPRPVILTPERRRALRERMLRREPRENLWRGEHGTYNARLIILMRDLGLMKLDLDQDPTGHVVVPAVEVRP